MWTFSIYVIALLSIFNPTVNARENGENDDSNLDGYYWKDFTGHIPKDALEGGRNANGKTTYIGQVLHTDQLIPAKIDPEAVKVYYEWGYKEYEATKNIKILCTKNPEKFEWIDTGNGLIQNIKDKHLLIGGHEAGAKIYIGRKQLDKELAVGKVISTELQTTLNTTEDGKGIQHAEFQVLSYNAKIDASKKKKDDNEGGHPIGGITDEKTDLECKHKRVVINFFN